MVYIGKQVQILAIKDGRIEFRVLDPKSTQIFLVDIKDGVIAKDEANSVALEAYKEGTLFLSDKFVRAIKIPVSPTDKVLNKQSPEAGGVGVPSIVAPAPHSFPPPNTAPKISRSAVGSTTLSLLRAGPLDGAYLSSATSYLGFAGNQECVEVRSGLQHRELEIHLQGMRSTEPFADAERTSHVRALSDAVTNLVRDVPGWSRPEGHTGFWHVNLAIDPHELTFLPFELMRSKRLHPLLLDRGRPVSFTRAVRGARPAKYSWPAKPRALLAWSNWDSSEIFGASHELEMRRALRLWAGPPKGTAAEDFSEVLDILPNASLRDIQEACATTSYTHVHIAAHGVIQDARSERSFGLALRKETSADPDVVRAEELSSALTRPTDTGTHRPSVVTLASCDSAHGIYVEQIEGNLARALHSEGFPFVLGTQFAISGDSSSRIFGEFYTRILLGEDPRIALFYARQVAKAAQPNREDWASLVAYANFSENLSAELGAIAHNSALEGLRTATKWAYFALGSRSIELLKEANHRLDVAFDQLKGWLSTPSFRKGEGPGLLGSAYKRKAELAELERQLRESKDKELETRARDYLVSARDQYREATKLDPTNHWFAVQDLVITAVLTGHLRDEGQRWLACEYHAKNVALYSQDCDALWAHGSLVELYLLRPLVEPDSITDSALDKCVYEANEHVKRVKSSKLDDHIEPLSRQLSHYVKWWPTLASQSALAHLSGAAEKLLVELR